jgi:hypothetical protein
MVSLAMAVVVIVLALTGSNMRLAFAASDTSSQCKDLLTKLAVKWMAGNGTA